MTDDSVVSIVVPVRNGAATIAACIESLLLLDWPAARRELIIVDNASRDATPGVLQRFGDRVRVVQELKRGRASARNTGIRAARGEWIALTDADCVVDPGWLRNLLPPLADPTVGIAGGRVLAMRPCNRVQQFGEEIHDQRRAIEEYQPPYVVTANWASRRAVIEQAGFFNEALARGSDVELAYRIGDRGYRLVYCAEALVFHRHEATLQALFKEGWDHGRGSVMLRVSTGRSGFLAALQPRAVLRRLRRGAFRVLRGPERFHALCATVVELGKLSGKLKEFTTLTLGPRPAGNRGPDDTRPRTGRSSDPS